MTIVPVAMLSSIARPSMTLLYAHRRNSAMQKETLGINIGDSRN
jgi:hypothetical protein